MGNLATYFNLQIVIPKTAVLFCGVRMDRVVGEVFETVSESNHCDIDWLVVSTHLKNISQNGNLPK